MKAVFYGGQLHLESSIKYYNLNMILDLIDDYIDAIEAVAGESIERSG